MTHGIEVQHNVQSLRWARTNAPVMPKQAGLCILLRRFKIYIAVHQTKDPYVRIGRIMTYASIRRAKHFTAGIVGNRSLQDLIFEV